MPRRGSSNDSPDDCLGQLAHTIAKNERGAEVCHGTFQRKPDKFPGNQRLMGVSPIESVLLGR